MIYMINSYLKELVKVPEHQQTDDFSRTMFGDCTTWFHGICPFEDGEQVAPCIGCPMADIQMIERQTLYYFFMK